MKLGPEELMVGKIPTFWVLAKRRRCSLCLQSFVTEELNGAQKGLSACLERTSQEPYLLQGPLAPW